MYTIRYMLWKKVFYFSLFHVVFHFIQHYKIVEIKKRFFNHAYCFGAMLFVVGLWLGLSVSVFTFNCKFARLVKYCFEMPAFKKKYFNITVLKCFTNLLIFHYLSKHELNQEHFRAFAKKIPVLLGFIINCFHSA